MKVVKLPMIINCRDKDYLLDYSTVEFLVLDINTLLISIDNLLLVFVNEYNITFYKIDNPASNMFNKNDLIFNTVLSPEHSELSKRSKAMINLLSSSSIGEYKDTPQFKYLVSEIAYEMNFIEDFKLHRDEELLNIMLMENRLF